MRKKIPCRVIKTISTNNYSSYINDSKVNHPYNLHLNNTLDFGTKFYTVKMKTFNFLNNDYIIEYSFDYYA